jgi:hypothetical protein
VWYIDSPRSVNQQRNIGLIDVKERKNVRLAPLIAIYQLHPVPIS